MTRVLIADDNRDLLNILASRFRTHDFEVIEAQNGADALALIKSQRPDVVVLDVMMPELNGFQVCRQLRADEKFRQLPIVLLTAKATEADKFWGDEVGATLYLVKPVEPAVVLAQVQTLLKDQA